MHEPMLLYSDAGLGSLARWICGTRSSPTASVPWRPALPRRVAAMDPPGAFPDPAWAEAEAEEGGTAMDPPAPSQIRPGPEQRTKVVEAGGC